LASNVKKERKLTYFDTLRFLFFHSP